MVLSSSKAENNKHNHTLLSWIAHIKQDHDNSNKPTSIAIDPVVQKDPLLLQQPINVATVVLDPPPKSRGSDDSSNTNSKRQSLFHFHRPHGLFRQNIKEKQVNQDTTPIETKLRKSPSISASTCSYCQSMCASLSDNDADDERTVNDDNDARSIDGTKKPFPCRFSPPEPQYNRDNSVHTLLGDIDSSQTGFKKLRKDGYLDDLDDVNCFLLEQEAGDEDDASAISKKRSVFSRAVIRNNLIRLALNGPFESPIPMEDKRHVLHVGCSDGSWCIDTASLFPHWLVVGIDDKTGGPCPDQHKVPKNFKYIRCFYDLLRTLKEFPSHSFDLVYTRFLFDAYSEQDYLVLIKECLRICKSNGYIEFYELDMRIYGNPKAGPSTHTLNEKVFQSLESCQLNPRLARKIGDMVRNLTDSLSSNDDRKTKEKYFDTNYTSLPLGIWGGRLGVLFRDSINELFFENIKLLKEELIEGIIPHDSDIEAMNLELDSQKAFMNLHHVYARKGSSC